MTNELSEDIKKAIEKNLPAEITKTLLEVLKENDTNKEKLKEQAFALEQKDSQIKSLSAQHAIDVQELARVHDFETRLKLLEHNERELKVYKAELQRDEALKRADEQNNLIGQLFKSPIVRRVVSQSDFTSSYYD